MNCGSGVILCGVLSLETGYGPGYYSSDDPEVHGLWPQVDPYGNSKCVKPTASNDDPNGIAKCYQDPKEDDEHQMKFVTHEWRKHGVCAGVESAKDYFNQICDISREPLEVMKESKEKGGDIDVIKSAIEGAGYEVHDVDYGNEQLFLSVCAGEDGRWKHSKVDRFWKDCGKGGGEEG